jgi:hypothetical protein
MSYFVIFEVTTAVTMKNAIFWDVTPLLVTANVVPSALIFFTLII